MEPTRPRSSGFRRIETDELAARLRGPRPPLVLDVRTPAALAERPGVPGAVPFFLDRDPPLLPDLELDHPIVTYCL